jgi:hypothetical protein
VSGTNVLEEIPCEALGFVLVLLNLVVQLFLLVQQIGEELVLLPESGPVTRKTFREVDEVAMGAEVEVDSGVVLFCFMSDALEVVIIGGALQERIVVDRMDGEGVKRRRETGSRFFLMGGGGRSGGVRDNHRGSQK